MEKRKPNPQIAHFIASWVSLILNWLIKNYFNQSKLKVMVIFFSV